MTSNAGTLAKGPLAFRTNLDKSIFKNGLKEKTAFRLSKVHIDSNYTVFLYKRIGDTCICLLNL